MPFSGTQAVGDGAAARGKYDLRPAAKIGQEPEVALTPLTAGREVVEDYRAVQLSLRDHPVTFLRGELDRRGITPADRAKVAAFIASRARPGRGSD